MKTKFFINTFLCFCLGLVSNPLSAQIQDNVINDPGDIAIVGYFTNGGISFVLLDNCPNNTVIVFTDEEWTGSAFASLTNEGDVTWTNNTGSTIARGTVIHINGSLTGIAQFDSPITCNLGSATETDPGFTCATADGVTAFIGSRSSVTAFLTFYGDATTLTTSFTGTGLTVGTNAITTGANAAGGRYTGSTTCNSTVIACATMINTIANWTSGAFTYPTQVVQFFNGSALPVELTAFEGKNNDNQNLLTWQTASETNNKGFEIERSSDGSRFEKIGFVEGKGTTSQTQRYTFEDNLTESPLWGFRGYYRLKQLDFDGRFEYSKTIVLANKNIKQNTVIYPNPSQGVFNVSTTKTEDKMLVFNNVGILVRSFDTAPNQLDLSDLPSGMYWVTIGEEKIKVIKM